MSASLQSLTPVHSLSFAHRFVDSPIFQGFSLEQLASWGDGLEVRSLEAKETLFVEGESASSVYFVLSGAASVSTMDSSDHSRSLAQRKQGDWLGEGSLLDSAIHTTTASAVESTQVLVASVERLFALLVSSENRRIVLEELLFRSCPKPVVDVHVQENKDASGESIFILKHPKTNAYFRLSCAGWFLWEHMDGFTTQNKLSSMYMKEFKSLRPDFVSSLVTRLTASGFLDPLPLCSELEQERALASYSQGKKSQTYLQRLATWRWTWRNADPLFQSLYRNGGRWFCHPISVGLMLLVGFLGLVGTAGSYSSMVASFQLHSVLLLWLVPMMFLDTLLHEAAHGVATQHVGCRVNGAGVGWYWFMPVAFVDTSDAWLASRRSRLWISVAGPLVNFALGGISAGAAIMTSGALQALLWQFSLSNFLSVLANLNPLMKLDGYLILTDVLDRPNLRSQSFAWLRTELPKVWWKPQELWKKRVEGFYALGSCLFLVALVATIVALHRLVFVHLFTFFVSPEVAGALGWLVASAVAVLSVVGLWTEVFEDALPS